MLRELLTYHRIDAKQDDVQHKQKRRPAEYRAQPRQKIRTAEKRRLAVIEGAQCVLVVDRKPRRDIPPEQIPPVIFGSGKPIGMGEQSDKSIHSIPRKGRNHHGHHINDQ